MTFSYNANYFLFATLENARNIAQGRVQNAPTSFPVLTGTPVAGMAYLDRPNPAGYFIFPDLSVRHEGKYRLSFALYEELKNQGDMDADESQNVEVLQQAGHQAHVSHRLEVKSLPFTVFSAKKFPGLTESTSLSRMVAEQGCRVRIRRDVRMRRRDQKDSKDWDDYEDETAAERARRTETPAEYGQPAPVAYDGGRPKSASNASVHSMSEPSRRTSQQDLAQQYAHGYHMQPQQGGYPGALQNGQAQSYPGHFQQPQAIMQPPQTPYQGSQHGYQPQQQMPQGYSYAPPQNYGQQGHYEPQGLHSRHESVEYASSPAEYRRPPVQQQQQQSQQQPQGAQYHAPQMMGHYGGADYSRPPAQAMQPPQNGIHQPPPTTPTSAHPANGHSLAPLKPLQPPATEKIEPASPSYPVGPMSAASDGAHGSYGDAHRSGPPHYSTQGQSAGPSKRSFGSTFDTKHMEQPLRHGARPTSVSAADELSGGLDDDDDQEIIHESAMMYRRADGTHRSRRVPQIGV